MKFIALAFALWHPQAWHYFEYRLFCTRERAIRRYARIQVFESHVHAHHGSVAKQGVGHRGEGIGRI